MAFKQQLKKIAIDIIPVFIGILLAVIINNWRQSVSDRNYYNHALSSISLEFKENIDELEHALTRQKQLVDTLVKYVDDDDVMAIHAVRKVEGLYTADLKSTTWRFLLQDSKQTLVSYETISQLSEIDKYNDLIESRNDVLISYFTKKDILVDPYIKQLFLLNLSDLINYEKKQIKLLRGFNKTINEKTK